MQIEAIVRRWPRADIASSSLDGLKAIASAVVMACWGGVVHTSNSADDRCVAKLMSALSGVPIDPVTP